MSIIHRPLWAAALVAVTAGAALGQTAKTPAKAPVEAKPMAVPKKTAAPVEPLSEAELLTILKKAGATGKEKADACRQLALVGTRTSVPVLAELLGDEHLDHMARYALEPIPDPSVDVVLRAALAKLKGRPLVGVIGSIGVRHDAKAVAPLAQRLGDVDPEVAQAAARALGSIGTPDAGKALMRCLAGNPPAGNQPAIYEGLFRCAEALAARGSREEALAIYDALRGGKRSAQVEAGAQRAASLLRNGKEADRTVAAPAGAGHKHLLVVGKSYLFMPATAGWSSVRGEVLELRGDSWAKVRITGGNVLGVETAWVNLNQMLFISDPPPSKGLSQRASSNTR
jgi:hypothetical protein